MYPNWGFQISKVRFCNCHCPTNCWWQIRMAICVFWFEFWMLPAECTALPGWLGEEGFIMVPPSHSERYSVLMLHPSHLWFDFWGSKVAVIWDDLSVPSKSLGWAVSLPRRSLSQARHLLGSVSDWSRPDQADSLSKERDLDHADPVDQLWGDGLEDSIRSGAETSIGNGPNGATCRGWVREGSFQRIKAPSPLKRDKNKERRRERKREREREISCLMTFWFMRPSEIPCNVFPLYSPINNSLFTQTSLSEFLCLVVRWVLTKSSSVGYRALICNCVCCTMTRVNESTSVLNTS